MCVCPSNIPVRRLFTDVSDAVCLSVKHSLKYPTRCVCPRISLTIAVVEELLPRVIRSFRRHALTRGSLVFALWQIVAHCRCRCLVLPLPVYGSVGARNWHSITTMMLSPLRNITVGMVLRMLFLIAVILSSTLTIVSARPIVRHIRSTHGEFHALQYLSSNNITTYASPHCSLLLLLLLLHQNSID